MSRIVNIRERMGIPNSYLGMFFSVTFQNMTLQNLAHKPIGEIASYLRSLLGPNVVDLVYHACAFSTFISRSADQKNLAYFTANMNTSHDLMTSSWSNIRCYEYDYNIGLGRPDAVRRPIFPAFERLIYLMPRLTSGGLTVQICLRDGDWAHLKRDAEFNLFATYIVAG
ncbi:uncharacterized protein N7469_005535 [Penicillium citrinum]|uniref:Uncharacterized protein n=1 Tax=Penicillium citrinum TaxID=5077 RepID=A0A9W9TQX1_PENCI|nr:uncharacterized protein N7469_005535 [Penicillium citrinum]KAJ5233769.1 hypothetical protein N7469_005535 [Penicillium citrinum]